jgi:uncharacterized membrane protein YdjX (TVP38/TMEM64 family)
MDRRAHGIILILAVVLFTFAIYTVATRASQEQLLSYGYVGIFFVMLISSASVILPAPGLAVVFAAGKFLNPLLVGIFAGLGAGIGELTGYLAGKGGREAAAGNAHFARVEKWMMKNGFITILVLAAIPNPIFDLVGIAAGALKYDWKKFLLAAIIGNVIKATYIAYFGSRVLGLLF